MVIVTCLSNIGENPSGELTVAGMRGKGVASRLLNWDVQKAFEADGEMDCRYEMNLLKGGLLPAVVATDDEEGADGIPR